MALALGLHFDGIPGSTTIVDVSGKVPIDMANATISADLPAPLTGNEQTVFVDSWATPKGHITYGPSADLNDFGSADYSVDGWVYCDHYEQQYIIYGGAAGLSIYIDNYRLRLKVGGVQIASCEIGIDDDDKYHILYFAVWRVSGVTRIAVGGSVRAEVSTAYSVSDPTSNFVIGRLSATSGALRGNLDDLIIVTGESRLGETAPVPSEPFSYTPTEPPGEPVVLSVPLVVDVTGAFGRQALPLSVSVVPAALFSGAASVCLGVGEAAVWTAVITLDGADVTGQALGQVHVEAEEGAARIAEFILRPPSGTVVSLAGWTGRKVTIDVADARSGAPTNAMRLFTGVVDTTALDVHDGTLTLRCTDDLQGVCQAMSREALAALIGGYTSSAVFDAAAIGWAYAQDRLSTIPASLDISPWGQLRLTPWSAKSQADVTLDAELIGEASVDVQIAERSDLTNEVDVAFDYRFPRVKAECYRVEYTLVDMTGFAQFILDGKWFLQRAQVESAISSAGGTIESIAWTPLPDEIIAVGDGFFTPSEADQYLCMGFLARVSFDYTQTVEEHHRIRVYNARSIDAVGLRYETITGALEGDYPDLVAVESGISLYKAKISGTPPKNRAVAVESATTSVTATVTSETDRAAANAAMEALIAVAKTKIHASHRASRVTVTVPLIPALDLDKTLRIEAGGVVAQGKCVSVTHALSTDSGEATSTVTVALCSLAGAGITHDQDPTTAPEGTEDTTTSLSGSVSVVYNAGPNDDHVITVTFPEVDSSERSTAVVELPSSIAAPIDEDEFTLAV